MTDKPKERVSKERLDEWRDDCAKRNVHDVGALIADLDDCRAEREKDIRAVRTFEEANLKFATENRELRAELDRCSDHAATLGIELKQSAAMLEAERRKHDELRADVLTARNMFRDADARRQQLRQRVRELEREIEMWELANYQGNTRELVKDYKALRDAVRTANEHRQYLESQVMIPEDDWQRVEELLTESEVNND